MDRRTARLRALQPLIAPVRPEPATNEERLRRMEEVWEDPNPEYGCWSCGGAGMWCRNCRVGLRPSCVREQSRTRDCGAFCPCFACNPCRYRDWLDDGMPELGPLECEHRYRVRAGLLAAVPRSPQTGSPMIKGADRTHEPGLNPET